MRTIDATARTTAGVPVVFPKGLRAAAGFPVRALLKMVDAYLAWDEKRRQRLALLALSDEMLKDIGISRSQAEAEGSKPFWRD